MAGNGKKNETAHPIEKPMHDSHGKTVKQGHAGETARQSLKYEKDLNRALPQDQSVGNNQQSAKKENGHGA